MRRNQHGGNIYEHENVIDFSANINPLGMPKKVKEAAFTGVSMSGHYPEPQNTRIRRKISEKYGLTEDRVICGNGAAELIFLICQAVNAKAGLLLAPSFAEYEMALKACGSRIHFVDLLEEEAFLVTERAVEMVRTKCEEEEIGILFLCQPNNPTGQLTDEKYLSAILKICQEKDIILVLDGCFVSLLSEEEAERTELKIREMLASGNFVLLNAFTKCFAMAGLRLGFMVSDNRALLSKIQSLMQPWNVSLPAQMAGMAALDEMAFLRESRSYIEREKTYLLENLMKLKGAGGIEEIYGSEANFIFFRAKEGLCERMLERGLMIRDCSNYQGLQKGYYRIAVRTHEENEILLRQLWKEAENG